MDPVTSSVGGLRNATGFDVYGARVSTAGAVVGGEIAIDTGDVFSRDPVVAFDGANYVVAWERSTDVWAARVTTAGVVVDGAGIAISTVLNFQEEPAIASNGSGSFSSGRTTGPVRGTSTVPD